MNEKIKIRVICAVSVFSGIVAFVIGILFFIHQNYDCSLPLATDVFGQYGDFIGGFIGTLLSVVLLYYTLKSQIESTKSQIKSAIDNSKVYVSQQFNETFFHLLNQYNSIIQSLIIESEDDAEKIKYQGKEALHYIYEKMTQEYDSTNINNSRKIAVGFFSIFYASYKDFAPVYFRTIYRILNLIENSGISENEKVNYIKILRCQMTDTELALLWYNAQTLLGKNMRVYINEYNLLKHIMPLSLLEYRSWRQIFTYPMRGRVNIVLYNVRAYIHKLITREGKSYPYTSCNAKYNLHLSSQGDCKQIKVNFSRRKNIEMPVYDDFSCFNDLLIRLIINLFEDWLFMILTLINFGHINSNLTIKHSNKSSSEDENKDNFEIIINRKDGKSIE